MMMMLGDWGLSLVISMELHHPWVMFRSRPVDSLRPLEDSRSFLE